MIWSYGVTTVPSRVDTLLPLTLASLTRGGFSSPHLFVDGARDSSLYDHLKLNITTHWPALRTYGNWLAALLELYVREPLADRYAIFQDDIVCYANLKAYLEACEFPERGYWNLFTFPATHQKPPPAELGWYKSNQRGRSALGLVFNRSGVLTLLSSPHMLERPQSITEEFVCVNAPRGETWYKGQKGVDGAVITAFEKAEGWTEYVHNPSLLQHSGNKTTSMGNIEYPLAPTFKGEEFDPLTLLPQVS